MVTIYKNYISRYYNLHSMFLYRLFSTSHHEDKTIIQPPVIHKDEEFVKWGDYKQALQKIDLLEEKVNNLESCIKYLVPSYACNRQRTINNMKTPQQPEKQLEESRYGASVINLHKELNDKLAKRRMNMGDSHGFGMGDSVLIATFNRENKKSK